MTQPTSESVWDYPRPPRLEATTQRLRVVLGGVLLGDSGRGMRVLETSHPPVFYLPPGDVAMQYLTRSAHPRSFCEYKGLASYWTIHLPGAEPVVDAAWSYESPTRPFAALKGYLAFYANRVDECTVDGEVVQPQPGDFYGGWITANITGPFKRRN